MDSIFDTKPPPYRILHQTPTSEVYYREFIYFTKIIKSTNNPVSEIACSMTREEILKDWEWLFHNVSETLHSFENEDDITDFVNCKIESVIATHKQYLESDGL